MESRHTCPACPIFVAYCAAKMTTTTYKSLEGTANSAAFILYTCVWFRENGSHSAPAFGCCRKLSWLVILDMDYRDYITIEPNKRGGKPCVRGLRITVYEVLEYLASDMTQAEILDDFPDLRREDLKACIAYAADRERRLMTVPVAAWNYFLMKICRLHCRVVLPTFFQS